MESDDIFSSIGSFLGGLFGGSKAAKANAKTLAALNTQINVLSQENATQSKTIKYLIFGLIGVIVLVFFFFILKKGRK
jgi:hypothetical protein